MSINNVTIEGRVGNEPDHRIFDGGFQVCTFSLANNEYWKDKKTGDPIQKTTWIKVKGFKGMAETFRDDVKKGQKVIISGNLTENVWEDKDGNTRREHEIIAKQIRPLDNFKRRGEKQADGGDMGGGGDQPPEEHGDSKFTVSDIPF